MKMGKKLTTLACLCAVCALTACGSSQTPVTANTEAPKETEKQTVAVTEAVTEAEETITLRPTPIIKIGDKVDWNADYNKAKCTKEQIVENFVLNGVYVGKTVNDEPWMFYQDSLDDYMGTNLYTDKKLELAAKMMQDRADWCAENGMTFYFMICPNKNTIYPEYMPSDYKAGSTKKLDQIVDYLKANTTVNVVDVRDTLFAEKSANPDEILYYPYDTHWNNNGGFWGYQGLMEVIKKDFPTVRTSTVSDYRKDDFKSYFKDQCYYLGWYDTFETTSPVYTRLDGKVGKCTWTDNTGDWGQFIHSYVDAVSGYRDSTSNAIFECEYATDAPKAYVIHDSFYIAMNTFMKDSFSGVSSHWTTGFSRSSIKSYKPDIVIFQCVEAQLDSIFGTKTFAD